MQTDGPPLHFLNVEYFFRIIYDLFFSGGTVSGSANAGIHNPFNFDSLLVLMSHIWLAVSIFAYLFTLAAIGVLAYATMRIFQIRHDEHEKFSTIGEKEAHEQVEHSRWQYIQQLIESGQELNWRQAIIESDIMLEEMLDKLGYQGESVGEKLRAVNQAQFQTLNNAWEAHRVRNEIAHSGSAYELSETIAHRTIANYEAVFREHKEI